MLNTESTANLRKMCPIQRLNWSDACHCTKRAQKAAQMLQTNDFPVTKSAHLPQATTSALHSKNHGGECTVLTNTNKSQGYINKFPCIKNLF